MGTRVIPPEVLSCAKQGEREPYLKSLPKKGSKMGLVAIPQATRGKRKGQRAITHTQHE